MGDVVLDNQTITDNDIQEQLESVLAQLSTDQIRFVVARQEHSTDTAAAEAVGISRDIVYHWPPVVKQAVRMMASDGMITALHLRRRNLAKAMLTKVDGLESGDERVQQSVATEIIEWEMGRATQPIDMAPDDPADKLARLLDRLSTAETAGETDSESEP